MHTDPQHTDADRKTAQHAVPVLTETANEQHLGQVVDGTVRVAYDADSTPAPDVLASQSPAGPADTSRALALVERPASALASLPGLAVAAWRQPAVRSVVKTGGSAVALTIATRLAGRLLAQRGRSPVQGLVTMTDLLPATDATTRGRRWRERGEVTEAFIYIRRTVR